MPSHSRRKKATGVGSTQPASCRASIPLPARTTARTNSRAELATKNARKGSRIPARKIPHPTATRMAAADTTPQRTAGPLPSPLADCAHRAW